MYLFFFIKKALYNFNINLKLFIFYLFIINFGLYGIQHNRDQILKLITGYTISFQFVFNWHCIVLKDNIVTRSNIRGRYHNRVLRFHLTKQIPMRSIFMVSYIYIYISPYFFSLSLSLYLLRSIALSHSLTHTNSICLLIYLSLWSS